MGARRGLGLGPDSARAPPHPGSQARALPTPLHPRAGPGRIPEGQPLHPGPTRALATPPHLPSGAPAAAMMIVYNTHRARRGRREKASWRRLVPAAAPNLAQPGRKQVEVSMETRLLRFPGPAPATL